MAKKKKHKFFEFAALSTKGGALRQIKNVSYCFLLLGISLIIIGSFFGLQLLIDGVVFSLFAILLLKLKSRTVAIFLLMLSIFSIITVSLNLLGITYGGNDIILPIISFFMGMESVRATFRYHKLK